MGFGGNEFIEKKKRKKSKTLLPYTPITVWHTRTGLVENEFIEKSSEKKLKRRLLVSITG